MAVARSTCVAWLIRTPSSALGTLPGDALSNVVPEGRISAVVGILGWRRERDSNPRYPFGYNGFQDRRHQPLGHPSAVSIVAGLGLHAPLNVTFDAAARRSRRRA